MTLQEEEDKLTFATTSNCSTKFVFDQWGISEKYRPCYNIMVIRNGKQDDLFAHIFFV